MTADALKSAGITNLDTLPPFTNTSGEGGVGVLRNISGWITMTAAGLADTGSKYKMVRVPTNAKVKVLAVKSTTDLDSNGSNTLALDVGLYYSDATNDGTPPSLQGTAVSATTFSTSTIFGKTTTRVIDGLNGFTIDKRDMPLWQAAGLSVDPGGMFDVVLAVQAVAATAVAGKVGVNLDYVI